MIIKFIKKVIAIGLSVVMLLPNVAFGASQRFSDGFSKSSIISDFDTGRVIYEKNPDEKSAMASMSKIMTLLLTFDAIKDKKVSPDDVITIKASDVNREGTNIKLEEGEKITLKNLMDGMMIVSANDAALAIAGHVGGSYKNFNDMMNKKAKDIGMKNTTFYNPNGLPYKINPDGSSVENTTTARDVLTLSRWMYTHYPEELTQITDQEKLVDTKKHIDEKSTNPLLPLIKNVDGLKTGFTSKAGYCLAYSMKVDKGNGNDAANRLLGVTMGAGTEKDREKSAYNSLIFINQYYKTKILYAKDKEITTAKINNSDALSTKVFAKEDVKTLKRVDENFKESIKYKKISIKDAKKKPIGELTVTDKYDNIVTKSDIYMNISDLSFTSKIKLYLGAFKNQIKKPTYTGEYPVFTLK
ncbi:MAG: D-alanyl-D-alanine carboxypeptidase family protein [Peptostreptococcus sp.]|uniref:D-alanyl-D-alanine carboxypeptidase family protein n=1 Tax=Peptostreptococcus sp. TaxID=1262 RepID=UPI002FC6423A